MQYSASSFAEPLVRVLSFALLPREHGSRSTRIFPARAAFHSEVVDATLERLVTPGARGLADLLGRLRVLQQGSVHAYLLYVWLALLALFAFSGVTR
jgi:hypothetical protein